jgi:hypothetical protein
MLPHLTLTATLKVHMDLPSVEVRQRRLGKAGDLPEDPEKDQGWVWNGPRPVPAQSTVPLGPASGPGHTSFPPAL